LRELLTNYGPIAEVWLDGANGGDGWYGGTRERLNIDNKTYYRWPETWALIRQLQPMAAIFSDAGPDCRWCGNEHGAAGDPCWATISAEGWSPGNYASEAQLNSGHRNGKQWIPAEVDVSIRPGWFYHAAEDGRVRSPGNLMDLYFQSVGRGANLLLNVPPDRRGIVHENDARSLKEFGRRLRVTFGTDLAKGATATASNTRGNDPKFGPQNLLDGSRETYWASDDSVTTPEVTLSFKAPVTFSVVRIREAIRLGQRVDDWAVDAWTDGAWKEIAKGTAIGSCRLVRTAPVTTDKLRLRITKSPVCPAIAEFGLFLEEKPAGGAAAEKLNDGISKTKWKVAGVSFDASGSNGANAIDGKPNTLWHTHGDDGEHAPPQEIAVDMGETVNVKGFTYLPRQDGCTHGMVDKYEFYLSNDGMTWEKASEGEFANIRANPILQAVTLAKPAKARYFKFVGTHAVEKNHVAVAELGILADTGK
jgi:alpha-L-fucosidase